MKRTPSRTTPSIATFARRLTQTSSGAFTRQSKKQTLHLFHEMSRRVPAYRDFLARHNFDPQSVQTYSDLQSVPYTTKDNYVQYYSLPELSWDGALESTMFSTSSGSSGQPNFWPRTQHLEDETTLIYEVILKNIFELDHKKTLLINAYSMGLYVAGTFTLNACIRLANKGYPLTVITPGINKQDVLRVVKNIGHHFDQIVLCAYPPLAKDILDEGILEGIDWSRYSMRFISGGEAYSEKWRKHLYELAGVPQERYLTSSVNTYGSADAAILGHETPLSILIRTYASQNQELCKDLFGKAIVPSFHQYYPFWKGVSLEDQELCFSTDAGLPLLKYNIGDIGGHYTYNQVLKILKQHGISHAQLIEDLGGEHFDWKLPFVYLYGRSNVAATIYGLNIYPENVKAALDHDLAFPYLSGKFALSTEFDKNHRQFLSLRLELRKNAKVDRKSASLIRKAVYQTLRELNAEFKMLSDQYQKKVAPKIKFHNHGDPKHFPVRIKEQYLKKASHDQLAP